MEDVMYRKSILAIFLAAFVGLIPAQNQPAIAAQSGAAQAQSDPCPPPPPSDVSSGFKAAIACEWRTPAAVPHMRHALKDYMDDGATNVKMALNELLLGDERTETKDLYRAAFGVPDTDGQPTAQGLPDVLQTMATANTLNTQSMTDHQKDLLFDKTSGLIRRIFDDHEHNGTQALAGINSLFHRSDYFRALYKLLSALPTGTHPSSYIDDLETLRAAFEIDPHRLAKAVEK